MDGYFYDTFVRLAHITFTADGKTESAYLELTQHEIDLIRQNPNINVEIEG